MMMALATALACGEANVPTATIRVAAFSTAAPLGDQNALVLQRNILISTPFLQHVSQSLRLPDLWKTSEDAAVERLRSAIRVEIKPDKEKGVFSVQAQGLERAVGVKVLNDLCDYYVAQTSASFGTKGLSRFQVTIMARAQ
jgi:hypothetical protein